ncbi:MAG: hypothetical protein ACI83O_000393 [Patescibacteria group bacterium]|jgi:hypothetical protein
MVKNWDGQIMRSKYHLSVADRLFGEFSNYETKQFLVSTINELAVCATHFVNATLLFISEVHGVRIGEGKDERLAVFKRYMPAEVSNIVLDVFAIRRARADSPIELLRAEGILYLDNGKYMTLGIKRLGELVAGMREVLKRKFE